MAAYDAVVVGAGPNGLVAAVRLAQAGLHVLVREAAATPGGGARTDERTLPGFRHDVCSTAHPTGVLSPAFAALELEKHGLEWVHPSAPAAHPLDGGRAALLERSPEKTAHGLDDDAAAWLRLVSPALRQGRALFDDLLAPVRVPRHPLRMARFGMRALRSAAGVAGRFRTEEARALFAGIAAHSVLPLEKAGSAAVGLVLALAGHAAGWPFARGGSAAITDALLRRLRSLGGEIETDAPVRTLDELPSSRAVLLDVAPPAAAAIAGSRLPDGYARRLVAYRYGPGVFKLDWALDGPIPWANEACARAGTVHVGGPFEQIAAALRDAWQGRPPERPFVLLAQATLSDPTRAPAGKHTAWAYCHVPNGSAEDMTERIERQIERFAPGFRDRILARNATSPADLERYNPNLVGGDVTGGANDLLQTLFRPIPRWDPYRMPARGLYLCSASTPPGGGVHGMCGWHCAARVLADLRV